MQFTPDTGEMSGGVDVCHILDRHSPTNNAARLGVSVFLPELLSGRRLINLVRLVVRYGRRFTSLEGADTGRRYVFLGRAPHTVGFTRMGVATNILQVVYDPEPQRAITAFPISEGSYYSLRFIACNSSLTRLTF